MIPRSQGPGPLMGLLTSSARVSFRMRWEALEQSFGQGGFGEGGSPGWGKPAWSTGVGKGREAAVLERKGAGTEGCRQRGLRVSLVAVCCRVTESPQPWQLRTVSVCNLPSLPQVRNSRDS